MLAAERYDRIVEMVNVKGSIRVSELSEHCRVTEETIRRDLDRLEQAGRLRRSHGGAVSVKEEQPEIPYRVRETTHAEEKKRIAHSALSIIRPGDRILLDASTTAGYMAANMPDMPLTVLTNSIQVATELSSRDKIEVISTGGQLAQRSLSFVGPLAERSLETYHVDKLFLSCKGVHLEGGISESNELQARLKQKMVGISDQVILLADTSKFGVRAFARVTGLDAVHEVITDQSLDDDLIERLNGYDIKITRV
ncbi:MULTISPECIES: DeoR/GlpR family DNA-binding transcription regulator [Paenibacillus]|uniref:DeoR/GlpR family DNA-binding transcription regulator n=1 Tax=Paenibacillus TaxID=44249 RepID=UPI00040CE783|nr:MULTISPECIES: DeoR/GlpR family DNA-binding transcription regulator [Paenibacillus]KGP80461.1 DeoR faimly transcriptional regulator [Paenibacillus sp. MAEPY2]KGP86397.1 DeoR faimly transcriptional regulator [Paenibacillus sp. MAEPY1]OZQ62211.1 DeoR family transcriptional regulator [Paenibacillus taichungensis]HBU81686.1 DeoR/GlpR transcriptional regulator [Paenibacillus sp.]